ncbi:hypothetical protein U4U54_10170 [Klebsiella quasipneumoniae subsp. quasipneumoniae]
MSLGRRRCTFVSGGGGGLYQPGNVCPG